MSLPIDTEGAFKFCAKMIDSAVKEFLHGTIPEKQSAAAFLRSDRCTWMCQAVSATPEDIAINRLGGADLTSMNFKASPPRRRCSPATMIEWDNRSQTVAEWADEKEIPKETLRARIKKYGICKEVFYKRRLTKEESEVLL